MSKVLTKLQALFIG